MGGGIYPKVARAAQGRAGEPGLFLQEETEVMEEEQVGSTPGLSVSSGEEFPDYFFALAASIMARNLAGSFLKSGRQSSQQKRTRRSGCPATRHT